jgi:hypothetical protein
MTTTQSAHNATTGPAAGAALASLSGLTAGRYSVTVYAFLAGTVTAADADNIELLVDGAVTDVLAVPPAAATSPVPGEAFEHITTTGAIKLQAVGAAGAAAVYHTVLVVSALGPIQAE